MHLVYEPEKSLNFKAQLWFIILDFRDHAVGQGGNCRGILHCFDIVQITSLLCVMFQHVAEWPTYCLLPPALLQTKSVGFGTGPDVF